MFTDMHGVYKLPTGWVSLVPLVLASVLTACNRGTPDYYPFTPDWDWHYQHTIALGEHVAQQRYTISNRPPLRWDGRTVHVRRLPDGTRRFYLETGEGIYRIATQRAGESAPAPVAADSRTVLAYPLRRGQSWFTNTEALVLNRSPDEQQALRLIVPVTLKHVIESLDDSITVPAGTFHDCLRVHGHGRARIQGHGTAGDAVVAIELTEWYAPGIGLVKSVRRESSDDSTLPGSEVRFELEARSRR